MFFGLLGPLCVKSGDAETGVPAARQRVLLAALAVRAGQVVSFEELAEAIWDSDPPATARVTTRNYVKRLRQVLGPAGQRVVTRPPGYLLAAAPDEVDLLAFSRLCRDGGTALRAGTWQQASDLLGGALGLWRGAPLLDIPSQVLRDEHVPVLESLWLQASEWSMEAGLRLGGHGQLLPQLQALTRQHPLHERLRAQYMLALYRCGQQAEALAAYTGIRTELVAELSVEPGPGLRELHQRILAADPGLLAEPPPGGQPVARLVPPEGGRGAEPAADLVIGPPPELARAQPPAAVPHQLPAAVGRFCGRVNELGALTALLAGSRQPGGTVVITAIGGTAGIGKTTLAVHWAHRVAAEFPDGQLYVNLRGYDPSGTPVPPAEAMRDLLAALGTPAGRIPADLAAQASLYRSLLFGKRVLLLLDNARDAEQVRPLLPGGPGCLVVITSRSQLSGLIATSGAHPLALDLLTGPEAHDLLAARLGAARLTAEPAAAAQLTGLCAGLPLALAVTAARASATPSLPLGALASELKDAARRLDALETGDPASSVRAVFSWSLASLSGPAATLFGLLGLHPGPDIGVPAAASLAGVPLAAAARTLAELAGAHLITEPAPGRFGLHDLLRGYAAEQAPAVGETGRRAATGRLLGYYVRAGCAAAVLVNPARDAAGLPVPPPRPGASPVDVSSREQALAWYEAEHATLLAATGLAAAGGFDAETYLLSWILADFLDRRGRWHDWVATQRTALAAAGRLGDRALQARTERGLGRAFTELGGLGDAEAHFLRALDLDSQLGNHGGQASTHLALARVAEYRGEYQRSIQHARRALTLFREEGDTAGQGWALNGIGWFCSQLGDYPGALRCCGEALGLYQRTQDRRGEATTCDSLGFAHHHLGNYPEAIGCYTRAVECFLAVGDRPSLAETLTHLGDSYRAAGNAGGAQAALEQALAILDELDPPAAAQVRTRLAAATM
jgi:DNA-binding SARP family transcriptional activator/tetratricopeptide (TPR) repeat protein